MIRILIICIVSAMVCSMLRILKPELAMVVSLAAGICAVFLLWHEYQPAEWKNSVLKYIRTDDDLINTMLKAAGIGIIAEFGSQICCDAGEKALAGRISLASRMAITALCGPMFLELLDLLEKVLA